MYPQRELKNGFREIGTVIDRGVFFLKKNQMPSGEFRTYISSHEDMKNPSYIKTVSMSLLIASALKPLIRSSPEVDQIISKSIEFILAEMEDGVKWKFFGNGSDISPDLDDTSYALALLLENNIKFDYAKPDNEMLQNRDKNGIFYTWFRKHDNNVDWVTNTNILYFYKLLNKRIPEVENYLREIVKSRRFEKGSFYYKNPFSFLYFFTRLCSVAGIETFQKEISVLMDFLVRNFDFKTGWGNAFNNILGMIALINGKYNGRILNRSINIVLGGQEEDGGWPLGQIFNHRSISYFYGSRELSTSLAIEGLAKYLQKPQFYR